MLDRFVDELIQGVNSTADRQVSTEYLQGGAAAAEHVVKTMARTLDKLGPQRTVHVFR